MYNIKNNKIKFQKNVVTGVKATLAITLTNLTNHSVANPLENQSFVLKKFSFFLFVFHFS